MNLPASLDELDAKRYTLNVMSIKYLAIFASDGDKVFRFAHKRSGIRRHSATPKRSCQQEAPI